MATLHGWPEAPFLDRLDCLFILPHSQTLAHPDDARRTIWLDHEAQHTKPLELGLARFLGELWVYLEMMLGSLAPSPR